VRLIGLVPLVEHYKYMEDQEQWMAENSVPEVLQQVHIPFECFSVAEVSEGSL